jgi:hypothetical protein
VCLSGGRFALFFLCFLHLDSIMASLNKWRVPKLLHPLTDKAGGGSPIEVSEIWQNPSRRTKPSTRLSNLSHNSLNADQGELPHMAVWSGMGQVLHPP